MPPRRTSSGTLDSASIPDDRIHIEQRDHGVIVVRVRSEGPDHVRLPDAVFSFRCGDPQYAYWLARAERQLSAGAG
jgi:hypothetical protein